ncbi:isoprenylcysteine carboxylmethyltransferase family protein [uncultured Kriegella sp.]|uniref:methyltransferase family protein n=1 Tax=uncultured Kriegella sp. TaxID=1798910 RepID=UPI0030DD207E|tara:strand:- start:179210 stop:179947 length:738 start_codon:yes stop_codon:yes gene_type:complete
MIMVKIGNFFFRTRNYLFPVFYVFLFLPFTRISENYTTVFFIGLAIVILGQLVRMLTIGLVYIVRGGRNRRIYAEGLVTDGLFSHCRNPMYVGNILLIIGMSVLSNSLFAVVVMIPLFMFIYQTIVQAEEAYLRNSYGGGFDNYCASTNRWIPRLKGIGDTFRKNDFDLKKVVFKEYNTTYLWMLGATLLLAYNTHWLSSKLTLKNKGLYFLIAIAVLTSLYFTIRFIKKRQKRERKKMAHEQTL